MRDLLIQLPEDQLTQLMRFTLGFVLCLGAIIGSFLNVCIYRIPLEMSVSTPRSHCFGCGKTIPWYFNIPVLSWVILRGKCAYCKSPISVRYPAIEALTAVLFLLVFQMWANPGLFALNHLQLPELIPFFWLFVASTVVNVMIDFDHRILLDRISLGGTLIAVVVSGFFPLLHMANGWLGGVTASLIGAGVGLVTGLVIALGGRLIFLQEAFGLGDVKWMMLFGAIFGWRGFFFIMMLSAILGLLMGVFALIANRTRKQGEPVAIPFGPALGLGALLWLFWGNLLLRGFAFARDWMSGHPQIFLYAYIPILILLMGWLCFRIHVIRKAAREEDEDDALEPVEDDSSKHP